MTATLTNDQKLALAAQWQREAQEAETKAKEARRQLKALKEGPKVVKLDRIRETEKGQLSVYMKYHRFPKTFGREELLAMLEESNVVMLREAALKLPTYDERKERGLIGNKDDQIAVD